MQHLIGRREENFPGFLLFQIAKNNFRCILINVLKASSLFLLNNLLDLSNKIDGEWGWIKKKKPVVPAVVRRKRRENR